jgi:Uma2 family endonuclease
MSAIPINPIFPSEGLFPISVEMYHEMIRAGVFDEDDPIELLEGALVFKMPKNPPHETSLGQCQDILPRHLLPGWLLRLQAPITLEDGEPEPDVAIVRGTRRDFQERHPFPSDVALVIEVADSTLGRDRGIKLRSYARAGIAHYWIINLTDRVVEVYSDPKTDAPEPAYASTQIVTAAESITLPAAVGGASIRVADLLP